MNNSPWLCMSLAIPPPPRVTHRYSVKCFWKVHQNTLPRYSGKEIPRSTGGWPSAGRASPVSVSDDSDVSHSYQSLGQRNGRRQAFPHLSATRGDNSSSGIAPRSVSESEAVPDGGESDPEAAVLLVACAIGVLTGSGVVLFNTVIHSIQDVAWGDVLHSQGGVAQWARNMPQDRIWPFIVLPPVLGGLSFPPLALPSFIHSTGPKI